MSEITKEDLRELQRDIRAGQTAIQDDIRSLFEKLGVHILEDSEREGKTAAELATMRTKLDSLGIVTEDRSKFMRGWVGGLVALAIASAFGFLFREAIARPAPSQITAPPQIAAPPPAEARK